VKLQSGFTLIELMVTVAIVAILASIAYPSYQSYLLRGRRSSAQAHLMDIAQRQQQYLLDARAYAPDLATLNVTTPADVSKYYQVNVSVPVPPTNPPSFTVTATAIGIQASDGTLTITNTGEKTPADKW